MRPHVQGLSSLLWGVLRSPVPEQHRADLTFGLLLLVLFLIQVATGILLTLYFQPSPAMVAESVQYIMRDVSFGWLVRGTHHWSAQALVVVGMLQVARIFVRGLYRTAGSSIWYSAMAVLALLAMLAFSGEVLAWDDIAYWRLFRVVRDVESLPALGPPLARMLRGGDEIGATTLSRTYSAHTMFLPWAVWMLILLDTWLLARRMKSRSGGPA